MRGDFSSNAGERVRVNLSFFAVHNEGGARQNFLKLHASGTAFHDLRRAPRVAERLVRSWRAGRRYGAFADFTAAALRLGDGAGARLFPMNCGGFAGFRMMCAICGRSGGVCEPSAAVRAGVSSDGGADYSSSLI